MPPPWTVIYPPFEDRGRAEACVLERANSSSRLRLTVSRSNSKGSLMLGASNSGLSLAGLPTSLEPNRYYRQRATTSHAKFRALAAQPRPRVLGQSRGTSAGADGFSAAEPEPEPEPEPTEPRFARHVGLKNEGAADAWEHQLSRKYASLHQGVNTSKAFQMIDKNRDSVMDRDEVLHAMVSGGVKVTAADLDDIMAQADTNKDGHLSFDEFESGVMKNTRNVNSLNLGGHRPTYRNSGGAFTNMGGLDPKKKGTKHATDEEVDEYMQSIRDGLDGKYDKLQEAFKHADGDKSNHLSMDEMAIVIQRLGIEIPLSHLMELFYSVMDKDGDGNISYYEFTSNLKRWAGAAR